MREKDIRKQFALLDIQQVPRGSPLHKILCELFVDFHRMSEALEVIAENMPPQPSAAPLYKNFGDGLPKGTHYYQPRYDFKSNDDIPF